MARKKSASGRSKGVSVINKLFIQAERINKRLRALEKADLYGIYKTKELQRFASQTEGVSIERTKSGKHRVVVSPNLTSQQQRLVFKKFSSFLESKLSTPIGIAQVRAETEKKVKSTLGSRLNREISKADLDRFYEVANYAERVRRASILEKIDPSLFMQLVDVAKKSSYSEEQWENLLGQYINGGIKNQTMKEEAEYLYNKYVEG